MDASERSDLVVGSLILYPVLVRCLECELALSGLRSLEGERAMLYMASSRSARP